MTRRWPPQSDPGTRSYYKENPTKVHPAKLKLIADLDKGYYPQTIHGLYGPETEWSDAFLEEVIRPQEGGIYVKIYGCSFLYKGYAPKTTVDGLQLAKSLVSNLLFQVVKTFPLAFAFKVIFRRGKLIKLAEYIFEEINHKVLRHYDIPENEYNAFAKEIRRAVEVAVRNERLKDLVIKVVRFVLLVLEVDNGYRFRIQDALGAGKRTFFEILDVLISRETRTGIAWKWKYWKWMLRLAFVFAPELKRIVDNTLKELDFEKVKMDASDRFFSLLFKSYNIEGREFEDRQKEWMHLNEINNHWILSGDEYRRLTA